MSDEAKRLAIESELSRAREELAEAERLLAARQLDAAFLHVNYSSHHATNAWLLHKGVVPRSKADAVPFLIDWSRAKGDLPATLDAGFVTKSVQSMSNWLERLVAELAAHHRLR